MLTIFNKTTQDEKNLPTVGVLEKQDKSFNRDDYRKGRVRFQGEGHDRRNSYTRGRSQSAESYRQGIHSRSHSRSRSRSPHPSRSSHYTPSRPSNGQRYYAPNKNQGFNAQRNRQGYYAPNRQQNQTRFNRPYRDSRNSGGNQIRPTQNTAQADNWDSWNSWVAPQQESPRWDTNTPNKDFRIKCYNCQQKGHIARTCPEKTN